MTFSALLVINMLILGVLVLSGATESLLTEAFASTVKPGIIDHTLENTANSNAKSAKNSGKSKVLASFFSAKDSKKYDEIEMPKNAASLSMLQAPKNIDPQAKTTSAVVVVDDSALSGENAGIDGNTDFAAQSKVISDQISLYTVRAGDTLEQVADMYDVTVDTILSANDLKRGSVIKQDQVLVILPVTGIRIKVKSGDTLAKIAKAYGADPKEIAEFNNVPETGALAAGTSIIIPDAVGAVGPGHTDAKPTATVKKVAAGSKAVTTSAGYFSRPVKGGTRTQGLHGNNGIDIAAAYGTPVYAAAAGQVIIARSGGWGGGYGNYVVIKHSNGTQTLYGHLSKVSISEGSQVDKGDKVGEMGNSGQVTGKTGIHLHFEVRGGRNPF